MFVIRRDPRKLATSQYCVGFKYDRRSKYFHVKLGPKTIICGYENLFGHKAEYTYKALSPVDAYGLRKSKLQPLLVEEPYIRKLMCQYTLEYHHQIVRKPMLAFKKNILSQITRRQDQDVIIAQVDAEIQAYEEKFKAEYEYDWGYKEEEED